MAEPIPIPSYLAVHKDGALLAIKVQPRASANEVGEPLGDALRVRVTAPPVDAAANEAVLRLLSERLDCARNRIELLRGHTSRLKTVLLRGISPTEAAAKLRGES